MRVQSWASAARISIFLFDNVQLTVGNGTIYHQTFGLNWENMVITWGYYGDIMGLFLQHHDDWVCLKMVDISPLSAYFNREDSDS